MADIPSETPLQKTVFLIVSGYQLQIVSWLQLGPCVHFLLSELDPSTPWLEPVWVLCMLPQAVSSCVRQQTEENGHREEGRETDQKRAGAQARNQDAEGPFSSSLPPLSSASSPRINIWGRCATAYANPPFIYICDCHRVP